MYKRKRAGNTITRKINSTKDTAAKADKNHYISNSYLEGFIPIDTEYFTASSKSFKFLLIFSSPDFHFKCLSFCFTIHRLIPFCSVSGAGCSTTANRDSASDRIISLPDCRVLQVPTAHSPHTGCRTGAVLPHPCQTARDGGLPRFRAFRCFSFR